MRRRFRMAAPARPDDEVAWADLSNRMRDYLGSLHLARLNKERGRRAPLNDPTMNALYRRGLATYREGPVEGDWQVYLWSATEDGKRLHMKFG